MIEADVSGMLASQSCVAVSTKYRALSPEVRSELVEEFIENAVELVRQMINDRRVPEEKHYQLFKGSIRKGLTGRDTRDGAHLKPRTKETLTKLAGAVVLTTSDSDNKIKIAKINGYVFRRLAYNTGFTLVKSTPDSPF